MSPLICAGWSISIAPVQKMCCRRGNRPFGIESDGLELKRLRCCGNGFLAGDAQSVVHVGILSFLLGLSSSAFISKYTQHFAPQTRVLFLCQERRVFEKNNISG